MKSTESNEKSGASRRKPATTPEQNENRLIGLAVSLAEQQLRDGTASSQVISHYLKLGTTREQLEQERIANENRLLQAKVESLESAKNIEKMYTEAIAAMKTYSGQNYQNVRSPD